MIRAGIFLKLLIALLILSLVPMAILGLYSFERIGELEGTSKKSIDGELRSLGEEIVEKKALSVAKKVAIYLEAHPEYTLEDLRGDPEFRDWAVQPVGQTGYTALHELETGINRFHINPKVEDLDLHKLATKLPEFWRILEPHLEGTFTKGYYKWEDPDGKIRDKFMVCVPVEGSGYGIAATTYIDEFLLPRDRIYRYIDSVKIKAVKIFFITLIFTVPFAVGLSLFFSRRITKPLLHLAKVADRISTGDLGASIEVKTKDEIGVLAEAVRRMQTSLKAAIERLRRRP